MRSPQTVAVTILVDDESGAPGLMAEHGLALWIEAGATRILFDTGQGPALIPNARLLGVPLDQAQMIVLSHGHYDHTGGLAVAMAQAAGAQVFLHPGVTSPRYSLRGDRPPHSIGMPHAACAALDAQAHRIRRTADPVCLAPGVHMTGVIPRETVFEDTGGPFFLDAGGRTADLVLDEQALWIETELGLIVTLGCGHAGLINTLRHVRRQSGDRPIRAVIGGWHILNASAARIEATLGELESVAPELLAPCHCTGERVRTEVRGRFKDRFFGCSVGKRIEL